MSTAPNLSAWVTHLNSYLFPVLTAISLASSLVEPVSVFYVSFSNPDTLTTLQIFVPLTTAQ